MPDSPNPQPQIWVTLPQALRWIVTGEMPTRENREVLPSYFPEHTSRADLFNFWIEGHLKLYGLDGVDPRRPWTPLEASLTYEDDCREGTDLVWIQPQLIKRASFDFIDWKHSTLGRFILLNHEDVSHPYFIDLRVRWDDLCALTVRAKAPAPTKQSAGMSKGQKGRKPRNDWPLLAALSAMVYERSPDFRASGTDGKLEILRPILKAVHHSSPNNSILPKRSQFDKIVMFSVKVAKKRLAETAPPLMPGTMPIVAALVTIIREHDREPGEISCESGMTEQVELLLKTAADVEGGCFFGLSDIDLYKVAQAITERAGNIHKGFCRKPT